MPPKRRGLRGILFENKGLKLASVVLAVVCWYAIRKAISFEAVIAEVPLNIKVDEGWAVLDRSADTVDVLFQGSQDAIAALSHERTEVAVELRGKPYESVSSIRLEPKHVRAFGRARAVQIQPEYVTLSLDQEVGKPLPVKADIESEPPAGFEVEKVVCTPASVMVQGPRQRLMDVSEVRTRPIDLQGRLRSFRLRVPVLPPGERWVAQIEPNAVTVDVTIVERSENQELEDVRVNAMVNSELGPRVILWPNKVKVLLGGRLDLVEGLTKEDIHAYVDCVGLDPSARYNLPVRVHTPSGIRVEEIEPATVKVEMGEL